MTVAVTVSSLGRTSRASTALTPCRPGRAVGHSILTAVWHMLQTGELYRDPGGDYYVRKDTHRITRRLVCKLEALGHNVSLQAKEAPA